MVSIRCAHCKETHGSVADVRACATAQRHPVGSTVGGGESPATSYEQAPRYYGAIAQTLAAERARSVSDEPNWDWGSQLRQSSSQDATPSAVSNAVGRGSLRHFEDQISAGCYAVGELGATKFYRIDKPEQGKWKGYTFIKVQASVEFYPVKRPDARQAVLQAILDQGVQESSERYGRELGVCGVCGRTLTDSDSIARGIGPVCAGKMGW